MVKRFLFLSAVFILLFAGCKNGNRNEIIIFHAGSLSVPFKKIAAEYQKENPGTKILLEPAGSIVCARKITELKKPCDIIASADYFVINELLIPEYAKWNIRFATNEMVIAFQEKSKYSSEINGMNWMDVIMKDDVIYARSDPDADPGGYRSVMTFLLAEKYYGKPGLTDKLLVKNKDFIRPKEVDLIALAESNSVDYIFVYKSVAIQHNFRYIDLPDEIDLSDPTMNEIYSTVSVEVRGSTPSSKMKVKGEYIIYSATIPENAPNSKGAIDFMEFILSPGGMEIFRESGQDPIIPFSTEQPELIPENLSKYLKPQKSGGVSR